MSVKTRIQKHGYSDEKEVKVYVTETFDHIATMASALVERWALVAAIPDGEDSAGRQKLRLPTADELATRAFDIAEAVDAIARQRGHVTQLPDLNEINAEFDKREQEKAATREATRNS